MPIATQSGLLVAVCAISPNSFRTGSRTVAKNGASRFWMRQRGGAMTFAIPILSRARLPGLKLDNPRQLALMHALVRFAHIAAGNTFTTAEIHPPVIEALGCDPSHHTLALLR